MVINKYMKRAVLIVATLAFSSSVFADTVAWEATGDNLFGSLDLNTGSFNQVSNLGFTPAGLGEVGGNLYTTDAGGVGLYSLDPHSGTTSLIGNSSISYYTFGSTTIGLYMVDTVGTLWNINPANGSATMVGSTHLMMGSYTAGLSNGSNSLYIALGSSIYTINTTTGAASYIGTSGSTDFAALVTVGNTVYGSTIVAPNSVYTFNPSTGLSAFGTNAQGDYAYGLAPIVPEPSSFALLGLGLAAAAFGGYALKQKKSEA